jgi:hypothetical protein
MMASQSSPGAHALGLAGVLLATLLLTLCAARPAHAQLGRPVSSVWSDGRVIEPTHVLDIKGPLVSETTVETPWGVRAREFNGPSGRIFAIAWSTHGLPYIAHLYGRYFAGYLAWIHAHAHKGAGGDLSVRTADMRGHVQGHMGDWSGSAYVPALLPPGVSLSELGVRP